MKIRIFWVLSFLSFASSGQMHSGGGYVFFKKKTYKNRIIVMRHGDRLDNILYGQLQSAFEDQTPLPDESIVSLEDQNAFLALNEDSVHSFGIGLFEKHVEKIGLKRHNSPLADDRFQSNLKDSIEQLRILPMSIHIMVASPYARALETAIKVREQLGLTCTIIVDYRLSEWSGSAFGRFDYPVELVHPHIDAPFITISEAIYPDDMLTILEAENIFDLPTRHRQLVRIKNVLKEYASRQDGILVVGHYDTVYALHPQDSIQTAEFKCGIYQDGRLVPSPACLFDYDF